MIAWLALKIHTSYADLMDTPLDELGELVEEIIELEKRPE